MTSDFTGPGHVAKLQPKRFASLTEYAAATGQDRHSVAVDYDVFVNVKRLDAQDAASVQKLYKADEFDFRLKPASAAVDKGVALSTVTEGFAGRAPDLGALRARTADAALWAQEVVPLNSVTERSQLSWARHLGNRVLW